MSKDEQLEQIRAVLARHKTELLALPDVTGVGIGAGEGEAQYAIVVYLQSNKAASPGPSMLEGVPVNYVVTGTIKPLTMSAIDH